MLLLIRICDHFALESATNLNLTSLERSVGKVTLAIGVCVTSAAFGGDNKHTRRVEGFVRPAAANVVQCGQDSGDRNFLAGSNDRAPDRAALGVFIRAAEESVSVVELVSGGPADRAGLQAGDEIRYVGDARIRTTESLIDAIAAFTPGTRIDLTILRNGRRQIVEAELVSWDSIFGGRDKSLKGAPGRNTVPDRNDQNAERGAAAGTKSYRSYAYRPGGQPSPAAREPDSQNVRALRARLESVQRELNELKFSRRPVPAATFDLDAWWERQHHGAGGTDPALFQ
jgi:hypothetical protein